MAEMNQSGVRVFYRSPFPIMSIGWLIIACLCALIPVGMRNLMGRVSVGIGFAGVLLAGIPLAISLYLVGSRTTLFLDRERRRLLHVKGFFGWRTSKALQYSDVASIRSLRYAHAEFSWPQGEVKKLMSPDISIIQEKGPPLDLDECSHECGTELARILEVPFEEVER